METGNSLLKLVVRGLIIASALLGAYIASKTYHYEVVVRGILGLVVIFHIYRIFWSSRSEESPFAFSKDIKYVFLTFIYSIVFYWALAQIIYMIGFLIRLI